jgi:hypothetical protein
MDGKIVVVKAGIDVLRQFLLRVQRLRKNIKNVLWGSRPRKERKKHGERVVAVMRFVLECCGSDSCKEV